MPPFERPLPPFRLSQLQAWYDNVEPQMRDPDVLWVDLWERFNTFRIPLFRESDFFNKALRIAKLAKGRKEDIERIFEEENKQQQEKLLFLLSQAGLQAIYKSEIFPCEDAQDTVLDICQTGCLLDFARLLKGTAFGWEADTAEDAQPDGATSSFNEEARANPVYDYKGTQWPDEDYIYYETPMERAAALEQSAKATCYIGTYTYTRCTTPISGDPNIPTSELHIPEETPREKDGRFIHGKRKRDQSDDDDATDARGHRRERKSQTPSSIIDGSATDDNSTLDEDGHVDKRQKTESFFKSTSNHSSCQVAAGKVASRKRSRYDDRDNNEPEYKRARLEKPTAYTSPHTLSSTQQPADKIATVKKSRSKDNDRNSRCNRKGKKPPLKKLPSPRHAITRSARRLGQSTFCELDHSSKLRFI
ncbi:hypothetical protein V8C35DRAFT_316937 [Trichoderma chlorosporum]